MVVFKRYSFRPLRGEETEPRQPQLPLIGFLSQ